ncbi:hypothetical protein EVAR_97887_1 [Eumeta japonica]|uniref:Reverse transcriptase domain-containing protein n=1 Tax=Eumeta variegata TaxID=151549 RepID=A0A4C1WFI2_EUMVA|nr:hypothetical protein EVAR_97887_1 [Eumeta japonica]
MDELSMKCLLYADKKVILTPSTCGLQEMVNKMNDSVKNRGMKINIGKTKVMVFQRGESTTECDVLIEGEKVERVKEFVHLAEMRSLRSMFGMFLTHGYRNSDVRKRYGLKEDVVTRVERVQAFKKTDSAQMIRLELLISMGGSDQLLFDGPRAHYPYKKTTLRNILSARSLMYHKRVENDQFLPCGQELLNCCPATVALV